VSLALPLLTLQLEAGGQPPTAQAVGQPLVQRLAGTWRGTGIVTGRASSVSMTWETTLGGAFLQLRFRNEMAASAARPAEVFEGVSFYRLAAGQVGKSGTWMDSRGITFALTVSTTDVALVSDWEAAGVEAGRTRYELTNDGQLTVVDEVRGADGVYREFGRTRLRKAGAQ
jgi:hypothetical protein